MRITGSVSIGPTADAVEIETTRPELLPACVALVAHPDDERYRPLLGKEVLTPLFRAPVPVMAHALADPEKGSGVAMICTFGDIDRRHMVARALAAGPRGDSTERDAAAGHMGRARLGISRPGRRAEGIRRAAGQSINKARARDGRAAARAGAMLGEPRPIVHNVKFFEKGDRPLEIVTSRQWFIKTLDFRSALIERGRQLQWHPEYMRVRYENWVNGLNGDWCISRQRFFGVPFPLWYPIDKDGAVDYSQPIVPDESRLPIDPSTDVPDGYRADQRDRPGWIQRRCGHHGHMGDLIADAADRGRVVRRRRPLRARVSDGSAAARARHHPDLAVLDGACARTSSTTACPGFTRRSPDS